MKSYFPRPNEKGYNTLTVVHAATGIPVIIGFISTDFELADFWDSPEGMQYNMNLLDQYGEQITYYDDVKEEVKYLVFEMQDNKYLFPEITEEVTLHLWSDEEDEDVEIGYLYPDGSVLFSNIYNDFLAKKIEDVKIGQVIGSAWIQTTMANGK